MRFSLPRRDALHTAVHHVDWKLSVLLPFLAHGSMHSRSFGARFPLRSKWYNSSYHSIPGFSEHEAPVTKNRQKTPSCWRIGSISVRLFRSPSSQVNITDRGGNALSVQSQVRNSSGRMTL